MHRNREHPQLCTVRDNRLVRTAIPYTVGISIPPFERLDIFYNFIMVNHTRIYCRNQGAGVGVECRFL